MEQLEATETQEQEARQVAAFLEARPPRERELAELALAHPGAGFAELAQLMRPTAAGTPPAEATARVWFHCLVSAV